MLNGTGWIRTVLTSKLCTYAKLNCLKRTALTFNCEWIKPVLILNWIVWIRTVWLKWIAWNRNDFDN